MKDKSKLAKAAAKILNAKEFDKKDG